jgi:trk system potassium uptake protein TrkH
MINFKVIAYFLGILLVIESVLMLVAAIISYFWGDSDTLYIVVSSFLTGFTGFFLWAVFMTGEKTVGKKEGYLIVTLCWVVCSVFGALPYTLSNAIPSFTDAFFESVSGFTTTGATVLYNFETLSHGLLFWRSLTQWSGGIGIIVLSLVILPLLGIGGMQLFLTDVSGVASEKLHPRIKETAKRLLIAYLILTALLALLLALGGMPFFDSVCHSFATVSTGGFSTKQNGIAFYDSAYIQYVIIIFMIIAGANFSLSYFAMRFRFRQIWRNEEFRAYLIFITLFSILVAAILIINSNGVGYEKTFRDALFQVVSIISTTGFASADYLKWAPSVLVILIMLMFLGASSASTGGGIKIVRILILIKNGLSEFRRLIHPHAIIPARIDKESIKPDIITNVLAFVSVYILITVIGVIVISFMGYDLDTSIGTVITSLSNIGHGFGQMGPFDNYSQFSPAGKWFLSFLMIVGRLELFTVLIIFSPAFWRR